MNAKLIIRSIGLLFTICLTFGSCTVATSGLEIISDDDLVDRIKSNEFIIVLFSKPNCEECDLLGNHLFNLRDDLVDNLNAQVVRVLNSQLVRLYCPTKEPAIVFFRHGVPLLYDGAANADEIYQYFDENRVPIVKELSDENFEHLTQASTGATTGDWFILFYNRECIDCQRLSAVWEAVGAATRNRLNVARVDKDLRGVKTAKRFNIQKAPEFVFIRQGNFYRYEIPKFDVKSFVSFANEWYKNSRAEKIRVASSPFDDLVAASVAFIKNLETSGIITDALNDTRYMVMIASVSGGLLLILLIKLCWRGKRKSQSPSDESKKVKVDKKKKSK